MSLKKNNFLSTEHRNPTCRVACFCQQIFGLSSKFEGLIIRKYLMVRIFQLNDKV